MGLALKARLVLLHQDALSYMKLVAGLDPHRSARTRSHDHTYLVARTSGKPERKCKASGFVGRPHLHVPTASSIQDKCQGEEGPGEPMGPRSPFLASAAPGCAGLGSQQHCLGSFHGIAEIRAEDVPTAWAKFCERPGRTAKGDRHR